MGHRQLERTRRRHSSGVNRGKCSDSQGSEYRTRDRSAGRLNGVLRGHVREVAGMAVAVLGVQGAESGGLQS